MSTQNLNMNVLLRAVDKATKPLQKIRRGSDKTAQAMKASRSQLNQLNAAQKDLNGFRELKRGSERTSRSLQEQQNKVRELTRAIKTTEGPTRRLSQQRDKAIRQARTLKQRYASEQRQLHDLRRNMTRVEGVTGTYSQQQRQLAQRTKEVNRQIQRQERHLANVARRQKQAAAAADRYRRSQDRASRMRGAGAAGMATGGVALYAGARMINPGIEYGEQLSELQAITRLQKESEEFRMLAQQSRELGSSTQFSATETAAGQTFLARAGFTPAAIRSSMRDVLDLALAGRMDLARASDISSNIASAFKIDPEVEGNMRRVADTLTATSTRANVDLEMLGQTMQHLGQAEGLDVSLEQAAAMAGMLGNIGIQGSKAGTTLKSMMQQLTRAPVLEKLEDIGVKAVDSQGNLRQIPTILAEIGEATADMGNAERQGLFAQLFNARAASGMADLIAREGSGGITQFVEILKDAAGENARVARTMADNIGGDLKALRSAWEEVGISVTDTNDGPMRRFIQRVTSITRGVGDWIKANPELASSLALAATALAGVLTVGGALTLMLASVLGPIAMVRYGMTLLGLKSLGVVSGVKAAGGALSGLAKSALPAASGGVRRLSAAMRSLTLANLAGSISGLGGALKGLAARAIPTATVALRGLRVALLATGIGAIAVAIGAAAALIIKYWQPISAFFGGVARGIGEAFAGVRHALSRMLDALGPIGSLIRAVGSAIGGVIGWFGRLLAPVDASADTLQGAANAGRMVGNVIGKVLVPGIALLFGPIGWLIGAGYLIMDNWSAITGFFGGLWGKVKAAFSGGIAGVGRLLLDWSPLGLLHRGITAGLETLGIEIPERFRSLGSAMIDGLLAGIADMGSALKDRIVGLASSTAGWFAEKLGIQSPSRVFLRHGRDTVEGYRRGIAERERSVLGRLGDFGKRVRDAGAGLTLGAASVGAAAAAVPDVQHIGQLDLRAPDLPALQIEIPRRLPALDVAAPTLPALRDPQLRAPRLPALEAPELAAPNLPRLRAEAPRIRDPEIRVPRLPALEATDPIRLDDREPVRSAGQQNVDAAIYGGINISIQPAPGMDEQALARYVAEEVQRALQEERADQARRMRSALHDTD